MDCSASCDGVYADVHWFGNQVEEEKRIEEVAGVADADEDTEVTAEVSAKILRRLAHLEKEVKLLKSNLGENGEV